MAVAVLPDTPLTTTQVRALVSEGLADEIVTLRPLSVKTRLKEIGVFVCLWLGGAALTLTAHTDLESDVLAWSLWLVGILCSAIALNAFVLLLHEGMHGTLFPSRFWNRWASVLFGSTVLMSFSAYRVLHLRHHHYLGDERDPDDYNNYSRRLRLVCLMHFLRLAIGAFLYLVLIPILAWKHGSRADRRDIAVEYLLLAILYATIALTVPGWIILHGWFLPVVLTAYMTNIRGFTQHGITDAHDPLLASRTIQPPRVVAYCLLNENYHLEHHLFPEVPSYRLDRLHQLLWPLLPRAVTGKSYAAFLFRFFRATWTRDDTPIGLTHPRQETHP